nr:MAG TPA: hypothetical protein [Bacteriophage sp.]DAU46334.1 MAG TPA: hypothetical protein [Bacteriophage sp.]
MVFAQPKTRTIRLELITSTLQQLNALSMPKVLQVAIILAVAMIVIYLNVLLLQMLLKAFRAKTVG